MENQHRKIAGYRELSQEEIDLMNRIKAAGAALIDLQGELTSHLRSESAKRAKALLMYSSNDNSDEAVAAREEMTRFDLAEPQRWASVGKTDIQTGIMALVRAVAQPAGGV